MGRASALGRMFRWEIIPFHYMPPLLGGKGISHVGWDMRDHTKKKNYGYRTPPGPGCPHIRGALGGGLGAPAPESLVAKRWGLFPKIRCEMCWRSALRMYRSSEGRSFERLQCSLNGPLAPTVALQELAKGCRHAVQATS
jgi:hypothetical protein